MDWWWKKNLPVTLYYNHKCPILNSKTFILNKQFVIYALNYKEAAFASREKRQKVKLHKVVANEFCKKIETDERIVVDHIDENKRHNIAANL